MPVVLACAVANAARRQQENRREGEITFSEYAILRIVGDERISLMVTSHAFRDVLRVRLPTQ
jgi:hypothetical protein